MAVALAAVSPVAAAKSQTVKGELVSVDLDNQKIVVKNSDGGKTIDLATSKSTAVVGLGYGQEDVDSLVGLQGIQVRVKYRENGEGNEALLIRLYPGTRS